MDVVPCSWPLPCLPSVVKPCYPGLTYNLYRLWHEF